MEIGEAHATGGQAIEDGSLHRATVAAEVAVAEVVDEEGDDIRPCGCMQICGEQHCKHCTTHAERQTVQLTKHHWLPSISRTTRNPARYSG